MKPEQLPFVRSCYESSDAETKKQIEGMDEYLTEDQAKKLSRIYPTMHIEEFNDLLKKESPKLFELSERALTKAALHEFIDYKAKSGLSEKGILIQKVEEKIEAFMSEVCSHPESIDYEGDMVCKLYCYLAQIKELTEKNGEGDQLLHCEVPTRDERGERFDIGIYNDFDEYDDKYRLPLIAIEVKFNEYNLKQIENDFVKLSRKENKVEKGYFVLFKTEKTKDFDRKFNEIKAKYPSVEVYYKFRAQ